ncbi:MAG TPA: YbhB/YbcL family Raf kinase inhibitor-like protein [Candidatus Angelobacter sp.]
MTLVKDFTSRLLAGVALALLAPAPAFLPAPASNLRGKETPMLQLKSSAFQAEGNIPSRFTCEGSDTSPELAWSGVPEGTKTFALIVHDPDAPRAGGWTHWVIFNIPVTVNHIAENAPKDARLPGGGVQGLNDGGRQGYMGPCPPSGTHRYYFRLFALDTNLGLQETAKKADLEKAMQGHVVAQAELMGRYKKGSSKAA